MDSIAPRAEYFHVNSNNQLMLDDVNLAKLADTQGTPLFVASERILKDNAHRFVKTMAKHYPRVSVFYSVKTNYAPQIIQTLFKIGLGAEVVSHFELSLASDMLRIPGEKIVLNGPGKTLDEMELALARRIKTINVDAYQELETLEKISSRPSDFGIRFLPTSTNYTKFGIPAHSREMTKLLKKARESARMRLRGVHFHAGPIMTERKRCGQTIREATCLVGELLDDGFDIQYLDVGAGLEPRLCGRTPSHVKSLDEYAATVGRTVREFAKRSRTPMMELVFEPGTALVESSIILVTRVKYVKPRSRAKIAIVDEDISILCEARYDAPLLYPERDVVVANNVTSPDRENVVFGGPLCLPHDIYPEARVPAIRPEDIIVIFDAGAYVQSMSHQFINPRPKIVLVRENGRLETVRRAESFDEMLSLYRV